MDRDWGGQDRLDHVHAMTEVLPKDPRIDVTRAGVVGRSYGGYMTLTLAMRHPELWKAAVDMFGPYDLVKSFMERMPETWKVLLLRSAGAPGEGRRFPDRAVAQDVFAPVQAPVLVIQGANDPRVVEAEIAGCRRQFRAEGKEVDYLMFENEGHDVIKFENKVLCYNTITDFFKKHLQP